MSVSDGYPQIDWRRLLGPIVSQSGSSASTAIAVDELADLQQATWNHSRRAVRPRMDLPTTELPFDSQAVPWFPRGRFVGSAAVRSEVSSLGTAEISADLATHLAPRSVSQLVRPGSFMHYAAGDYYIQDAGSMLALALCAVQPGQWVCDTCAAPGGKSTGLLEQLGGSGLLVANEVIRSRLALLNLALARTGYGNQLVFNSEVEGLARLCGPVFDCVLVDAPCTGQTMLARGKQSLAAFSDHQILHSSARQKRILSAAAGLVKPQGRLVYSTCAFSYAENEQIVLDFVQDNPGWRLISQAGLERWRSPVAEGCYRVWPHRDDCSGAFAALLCRTDDDVPAVHFNPSVVDESPMRQRHPMLHGSTSIASSSGWQTLEGLPPAIDWMTSDGSGQCWQRNGELHRFAAETPTHWIEAAQSGCEIAQATLGQSASHSKRPASQSSLRWSPSFGSAHLTTGVSPSVQPRYRLELNDEQGVRYVAGETLRIAAQWNNWCLVNWRGRPLAWGKLSQGVLKNHFPKALRQSGAIVEASTGS